MTKPLNFTQAGLCRAINAARKAGLRVTGIRSDGTVLVTENNEVISTFQPQVDLDEQFVVSSKWEDIEA
jgi:hypothetical protein